MALYPNGPDDTSPSCDQMICPAPADPNQACKFLEILYGAGKLPGYLTVWTPQTKLAEYVDTAGDAAAVSLSEAAKRRDVYFGVGLRRAIPRTSGGEIDQYQRGSSEDVVAIPGLWVEADFVSDTHACTREEKKEEKEDQRDKLAPNAEALMEALKEYPLPFSILNHSGGGLHAYWLFRELLIIDSDKNRKDAADLLRRFQATLRERIFSPRGWKLHSTADLARVLRVPGTYNLKGAEPKPVQFLVDSGARYNLSDIEPYLLSPEDAAEVRRSFLVSKPGGVRDEGEPADFEAIQCGCAWIRERVEKATTDDEPNWYYALTVLARCGREVAHKVSRPYPRYSPNETDAKIDHALRDSGPVTCAYVEEDLGFPGCKTCPFRGRIRSPIELGRPHGKRLLEMHYGVGAATSQDGGQSDGHSNLRQYLPATGAEKANQRASSNGGLRHTRDVKVDSRTTGAEGRSNRLRASELTERRVDYLWEPYFPKRKVVFVDGDPGAGKSLLLTDVMAHVTRGTRPLSDTRHEAGTVIYYAPEDDIEEVVVPRLKAAGSITERVHIIPGKLLDGGMQALLTWDEDMRLIEQDLEEVRPKLVVFDPVSAFLGRVDAWRAEQVRPVLAGLKQLAERYECSVVVVRHLTKGARDQALYRGYGSIDFAAAARSILLVGPHPSYPEEQGVRVVAHVKNSLGPKGPSLSFRILQDDLGRPYVAWSSYAGVSAEDLLASPASREEKEVERSALEEARAFLWELLRDGPKPADEVFRAAKKVCISEKTLRRAKSELQVRSTRCGEGWAWELPEGGSAGCEP